MSALKTRYKITTGLADSYDTRPWMELASTTFLAFAQVLEKIVFTADTTDAGALEQTLGADTNVIGFEQLWSQPEAAVAGELIGRADYQGRARDVARGEAPRQWAWPLVDAVEAHLDAIGVGSLDVAEAHWPEIKDAWCDGFRRGYEAAHAED